MSAHFDRSQRFVFRYRAPAGHEKSQVIKAEEISAQEKTGAVRIESYRPTHFIGKQVNTASQEFKPAARFVRAQPPAVQGLKKNLSELNELHQRLKFMLGELETLMKKKS